MKNPCITNFTRTTQSNESVVMRNTNGKLESLNTQNDLTLTFNHLAQISGNNEVLGE